MFTIAIVRWRAIVAVATGLAWTTASVLSLIEGEPRRYLDLVLIVPIALTSLAVAGLYTLQRHRLARLGRLGFWSVMLGIPVLFIGQVGMYADSDTVKSIALPIGMVLWVGGLVTFGIATARSGVLPVWSGVLIALSQLFAVTAGVALSPIVPLSNSGSYTGAIGHGIVWFSIALTLMARHTISGRHAVAGRHRIPISTH